MSINNTQLNTRLNNILSSKGISPESINQRLNALSSQNNCDADCQKRLQKIKLYDEFNEAKNNFKNAPYELNTARKNYYIFTEGKDGYNKMMLNDYTKQAEIIKNKEQEKHRENSNSINELINDYQASIIYNDRMYELLNIRKREKKELKLSIDNLVSSDLTNARRYIYEDNQYKQLHTYRKWITFIYYTLFFIYLIFGNFFTDKLYQKTLSWLVVVLYLIFPFLINFITQLIFNLYYSFLNFYYNAAPRNVYVNPAYGQPNLPDQASISPTSM